MVKNFWQQIIGRKRIFIIAEAGVNHNGSLALAKRLVDAAQEAGADAVKFQTFKAERLVSLKAPKAEYQIRNTRSKESQFAMLKKLELSEKAHRELFRYCRAKKILFFSTPFDEKSADFLNKLGVTVFKIPSGEITNTPLLARVAAKRKPIILSTGMSTIKEIREALRAIKKAGNAKIILLHCVSNYPADPKDVNLKSMAAMEKIFRVPVGFSDHTLGIEVSLAAGALGARVIEKHFTLNRALSGPDHKISLEPLELKNLVDGVRKIEAALGDGRKRPVASEEKIAAVARKSLVAAQEIAKGTRILEKMIAIKRPGTGLPPSMKSRIVGKRARMNINYDEIISREMF